MTPSSIAIVLLLSLALTAAAPVANYGANDPCWLKQADHQEALWAALNATLCAGPSPQAEWHQFNPKSDSTFVKFCCTVGCSYAHHIEKLYLVHCR